MRKPRVVPIVVVADHAGFRYKEKIKALLESRGHAVHDLGTLSVNRSANFS